MRQPDEIAPASVNDPETTLAIAGWLGCADERSALWLAVRYRPLIARIAHQRMPSWTLAEEVIQDALTHLFASLHRYRPERPFEAWVAVLACHRCGASLDALRRRRVVPCSELGEEWRLESLMEKAQVPAQSLELDFSDHAYRLLARLGSEDREIFLLHYVEDYTAEEIATRCGMTAGAVRARAFRARHALQAMAA